MHLSAAALLLSLAPFSFWGDDQFGHSKHGTAFDSGMRTKPWKMEGIGTCPFPITTSNQEVQVWYDQGNALLHSFWFEEAERTFRWCHKLEPENAMVYFGLARCGLNWFTIGESENKENKKDFDYLREAIKRKYNVTERERLYIEAWENAWIKDQPNARKVIIENLKELTKKFPDDIEAKSQLGFYQIGQVPAAENEALINEVLRANPMHPGAHHAEIHNWDGKDGVRAIHSCELYGKAAPRIGHALHMPGHIYSKIGMWHEAAIAMDSATRVELKYMNDRLALPFETWNYSHNRNYLCYIQEQLGRGELAIRGALDLVNSPRDPIHFADEYPAIDPLLRALIKFEKWDLILDGETIPPISNSGLQSVRDAAEIMALAETKQPEKARAKFDESNQNAVKKLNEEIAGAPDKADQLKETFVKTLSAHMRIALAKTLNAEGNSAEALKVLQQAGELEKKNFEQYGAAGDPPGMPWPVMRLLGDAQAKAGDHEEAIKSYEFVLKEELNDGWALGGLCKSNLALHKAEEAREYAARFLAVWDGADASLPLLREIKALELPVNANAKTPKPERTYSPENLNKFGPSNWQPFPAPKLDCVDSHGKRVQLSQLQGKNVLLVFYLSDQCVHCMEQLAMINKRIEEFNSKDTVVLAVSSTTPAANRASTALAPFAVTLLSDMNHSNARRFASYDDFEDMELHSTILIDKKGMLRWKRTGGDPFTDIDFLLKEIARW